jgi:hypothetical protein
LTFPLDDTVRAQRCFAADALVTLANGKQKKLANLKSGEVVLTYDEQTQMIRPSPVLTMLHRQLNEYGNQILLIIEFEPYCFSALFKQVMTRSGHQLTVTPLHLVLTNSSGYIMAKNIEPGMSIYVVDDNGSLMIESVSQVTDVVKQGYVAPLTGEGTLIVNQVVASCYASIKSHHLAHAALAPMRWWYQWTGVTKAHHELEGMHWFPNMLFQWTQLLAPSFFQQMK